MSPIFTMTTVEQVRRAWPTTDSSGNLCPVRQGPEVAARVSRERIEVWLFHSVHALTAAGDVPAPGTKASAE